MGVADQMLLNQVTIFNPPSISTSNRNDCYGSSSKTYQHKTTEDLRKEAARVELDALFGDDQKSRYAFGWHNPREIYEEKK